jgi:hypothetical protein
MSLASNLPFVRGDARLLEEVLFKLALSEQRQGVHARPRGQGASSPNARAVEAVLSSR